MQDSPIVLVCEEDRCSPEVYLSHHHRCVSTLDTVELFVHRLGLFVLVYYSPKRSEDVVAYICLQKNS